MSVRSQDRKHTGKRGAAQRRARRQGYAYAGEVEANVDNPDAPRILPRPSCAGGRLGKMPLCYAAYRHGMRDHARKMAQRTP